MQKWEYLYMRYSLSGGTAKLNLNGKRTEQPSKDAPPAWERVNALGQDGWELVAIHPIDDEFWFKRLTP